MYRMHSADTSSTQNSSPTYPSDGSNRNLRRRGSYLRPNASNDNEPRRGIRDAPVNSMIRSTSISSYKSQISNPSIRKPPSILPPMNSNVTPNISNRVGMHHVLKKREIPGLGSEKKIRRRNSSVVREVIAHKIEPKFESEDIMFASDGSIKLTSPTKLLRNEDTSASEMRERSFYNDLPLLKYVHKILEKSKRNRNEKRVRLIENIESVAKRQRNLLLENFDNSKDKMNVDIIAKIKSKKVHVIRKSWKGDLGLTLFLPLDPHCFERLSNFTLSDTQSITSGLASHPSSCSLESNCTESSDDEDIIVEEEPGTDLETLPRILSDDQLRYINYHALPPSIRMMTWTRAYSLRRDGSLFSTMLERCKIFSNTLTVIKTTQGDILGGFADSPWGVNGNSGAYGSGSSSILSTGSRSFFGGGRSFLFSSNPLIQNHQSFPSFNTRSTVASSQHFQNSPQNPGLADYFNRDMDSIHEGKPAMPPYQVPSYGSLASKDQGSVGDDVMTVTPIVDAIPPLLQEGQDQGHDEDDSKLYFYRWTGDNTFSQICDTTSGAMGMGGGGMFGWYIQDDFRVGTSGQCSTFNNPPLVRSQDGHFEILDVEIYGFRHMSHRLNESLPATK